MNDQRQRQKDQPQDAKGTEVQAPAGTAVQTYEFGDDAGAGMEEVRADERKVPFVIILDAKSPQVAPPSGGGVAGAKAGMFYNTATGVLYDGEKGFDFVPCYRDEHYVEFIPREPDGTGGGFVGIRDPLDPLVTSLRAKHGKFGKLPTEAGTELVQTFYLYGLLLDPGDGTPYPAMLAFKSTQISKYQGVITRQDAIQYPGKNNQMVKPPLWAHYWHVSTRFEKAKKGANTWYGYVIGLKKEPSQESLIPMSHPLYQAAKALRAGIVSGQKKGDVETAAKATAAETSEEIPM